MRSNFGSSYILTNRKNYFYQLLHVQGVGSERRIEIQTAETFVLVPSIFEFEAAIGKLKSYRPKSPGSD
jgi:hypothetical protein